MYIKINFFFSISFRLHQFTKQAWKSSRPWKYLGASLFAFRIARRKLAQGWPVQSFCRPKRRPTLSPISSTFLGLHALTRMSARSQVSLRNLPKQRLTLCFNICMWSNCKDKRSCYIRISWSGDFRSHSLLRTLLPEAHRSRAKMTAGISEQELAFIWMQLLPNGPRTTGCIPMSPRSYLHC